MKRLLSALALTVSALLVGCQQAPLDDSPDDRLAMVERSGFDLAKADPALRLAAYNGVIVEPLGFSRLDIVEPSSSPGHYARFTLDDRDMQSLRELYQRQINLALGADGRYQITTEHSASTLRLVTDLVKLEPNAPREKDRRFSSSARNEVFSEGAGSLTLEAQLIDSVSGKTVMLLRDRLTDTEIWGRNNVITNRAAVSRAFTRWASQLRRQLDSQAASGG